MKHDPSSPEEWLRRARSNLARAKALFGNSQVLLEDLCFDAQQAVEKALKAIAVAKQIPFRKTHAIVDLFDILQDAGIIIPDELKQAAKLTVYAVETRYPGMYDDVSIEEYHEAVQQAELVLVWAERLIAVLASENHRR